MIDIFEINGGKLSPTPSLLSISVFKAIWNRDRTKKKEKAMSELRYVYLMSHPKSLFISYSKDERPAKVAKDVFGDPSWKPDAKVKAAIKFYEEERLKSSPTFELWEATVEAARSLGEFLRSIDFNERDEKGKLIHSIGQVTRAMKEADELAISLNSLYEKVVKEQYSSSSTRKGREINSFEK